MRNKIVAGNWKMNLNLDEGRELIDGILAGMPALKEDQKVVIAPPFINLAHAAQQLQGQDSVYLGAQDCHQEQQGAFTGAVSATMLQSCGVRYVIIGHSERREYFQETNELLAAKVNAALMQGLKVIFCCGENLETRDGNTQNDFVAAQLQAGLFHLSSEQIESIIIAYEPIWAIGTGRTASTEQAQEMHAHIRQTLAGKYGAAVAENTPLLYGGSCKPDNAAALFACPDVDGGLIGGAALKSADFLAIIAAMAAA